MPIKTFITEHFSTGIGEQLVNALEVNTDHHLLARAHS